MIARIALSTEEAFVVTKDESNFLVGAVLLIAGIALLGTGMVAGFWGIWHLIVGPIPKIFGISRLWLDICAAPFYAPCLVAIAVSLLDEWEDFVEDSLSVGLYVSFWEFLRNDWLTVVLFGVLIIDFAVGMFFSFAVGLAGLFTLGVVVGLGWLIYKLIQVIVFSFFSRPSHIRLSE